MTPDTGEAHLPARPHLGGCLSRRLPRYHPAMTVALTPAPVPISSWSTIGRLLEESQLDPAGRGVRVSGDMWTGFHYALDESVPQGQVLIA